MDEFIDRWHARAHGALAEGLAWLASHDTLPSPDGVIGDFVDVLCAMRFQRQDALYVKSLLSKDDPHMQEIGVRLAESLLRDVDAWGDLEAPMTTLIAKGPVDSWVAEALVSLLRRCDAPASIYRELAKRHGQPARGMDGIMRNRAIFPWRELESHYAQRIIQTLSPGERERAVLPVLEKQLGTKGFEHTQERILRDMGFDPKEHRARLRGRP